MTPEHGPIGIHRNDPPPQHKEHFDNANEKADPVFYLYSGHIPKKKTKRFDMLPTVLGIIFLVLLYLAWLRI